MIKKQKNMDNQSRPDDKLVEMMREAVTQAAFFPVDVSDLQDIAFTCALAAQSFYEGRDRWEDYDEKVEYKIGGWYFLSTKGKLHNLPAMYNRVGDFIYSDKTLCVNLPDKICEMHIPSPPKE